MTNVKIAIQCFENFGGGQLSQMPRLVARLHVKRYAFAPSSSGRPWWCKRIFGPKGFKERI